MCVYDEVCMRNAGAFFIPWENSLAFSSKQTRLFKAKSGHHAAGNTVPSVSQK